VPVPNRRGNHAACWRLHPRARKTCQLLTTPNGAAGPAALRTVGRSETPRSQDTTPPVEPTRSSQVPVRFSDALGRSSAARRSLTALHRPPFLAERRLDPLATTAEDRSHINCWSVSAAIDIRAPRPPVECWPRRGPVVLQWVPDMSPLRLIVANPFGSSSTYHQGSGVRPVAVPPDSPSPAWGTPTGGHDRTVPRTATHAPFPGGPEPLTLLPRALAASAGLAVAAAGPCGAAFGVWLWPRM